MISLALPYAPEPEAAQKPEPVDLDAMVLWHTPDKEGFATLNIDGHFENWSLASSGFRDFLSHHHFQTEGKMLSQTALEEKRRTLFGDQPTFFGTLNVKAAVTVFSEISLIAASSIWRKNVWK